MIYVLLFLKIFFSFSTIKKDLNACNAFPALQIFPGAVRSPLRNRLFVVGSQRECHSKPVTTSPTNIKSNTNLNDYNQQSIITYFTPPSFPKSPYTMPPDKPVKLPRRPSSPGINLDSTHLSYEINTPLPITKESPVHWRQTSIAQYFNIIPSMPVPLVPAHVHQTTTPKFRNVRQAVLSYRRKQRSVNKITRYTVSIPTYDLFDSWGHSLESIDANHTFRLFLQNPNGLSIHQNNHFLVHDLQQCYNYGAAVLCLPETKTNWDQSSQLTTLRSLFHKIWRKTSIQTSHFLVFCTIINTFSFIYLTFTLSRQFSVDYI